MKILPLKLFRVADDSMLPSIHDGDYVLVFTWASHFNKGDIIVLLHPTDAIPIVKRISGIYGGRYFVIGDNKSQSNDSRSFGNVGKEDIIGKVLWVAK